MLNAIRPASFGSVSSGTMRDEDLLDALSYELAYQMKRQTARFPRRALRALINEAKRTLSAGEDSPLWEGATDVVAELFDALEQFAPAYGYFGAHPGDGSDYGFWLSDEIEHNFDGPKVTDLNEVAPDYRGEVLQISDHGNMTLLTASGRGTFSVIWSLV